MTELTRDRIEALMKRCQIDVRYRQIGDLNDIMSDCYGALGAMMSEIERMRDELDSVRLEIRGCAQEMATMGNALIVYSTNLDNACNK